MIPEFDDIGNLPPGIHDATIEEVRARFATNAHRTELFDKLVEVLRILRDCNCPEIYLDGSFITAKQKPDDYDLCYEPTGIRPTAEFREFLSGRGGRKARYRGDIFVRMPEPPYLHDHVKDWQTDTRQDDIVKGIIQIKLEPQENAQK